MEHLDSAEFTHLNTNFDFAKFSGHDVMIVFNEQAHFHAMYYGNEETVSDELNTLIREPDVNNTCSDLAYCEENKVLIEDYFKHRTE